MCQYANVPIGCAICHDEKVAYLTFEGRKEAKKDSKNPLAELI